MQSGCEHDTVSLNHVAHTQLLHDVIPVDESGDRVGEEGNINNAGHSLGGWIFPGTGTVDHPDTV